MRLRYEGIYVFLDVALLYNLRSYVGNVNTNFGKIFSDYVTFDQSWKFKSVFVHAKIPEATLSVDITFFRVETSAIEEISHTECNSLFKLGANPSL